MVAQQVLVLFVQVRILVVQRGRTSATKVVGVFRLIREGELKKHEGIFEKGEGVLSKMSLPFLIFATR